MKNNKQLGEIDMRNLSEMGYTQSEINTAVNWVYSRIEEGVCLFKDKKRRSKSHRVLHQLEREVIEPDAYGYLIEMRELSLLNDMDLEKIIEKIFLSGYTKVTLRDIKEIAASYLLDANDISGGNRKIIFGPDIRIN